MNTTVRFFLPMLIVSNSLHLTWRLGRTKTVAPLKMAQAVTGSMVRLSQVPDPVEGQIATVPRSVPASASQQLAAVPS